MQTPTLQPSLSSQTNPPQNAASRGGVDPEHPAVTPGSLNFFLVRSTIAGHGVVGGITGSNPTSASCRLSWAASPRLSSRRAGAAALRRQPEPQGFTLAGAILRTPKYHRWRENLGGPRARGSRSRSRAAQEYECMYGVTFREQIQVGQFTL